MRIEEYDQDGNLIRTRTVADDPAMVNGDTLRAQAVQALADNRTFLAIASPTNAQVLAQVKALTRQNQGIIRLALGLLDGTD